MAPRERKQQEKPDDAVARLDALRAELAKVTEQEEELSATMITVEHADAVLHLRQRRVMLGELVTKLQVQAAAQLDREGEEQAASWLEKVAGEQADLRPRIREAQAQCQAQLAALVEAVKAEGALRHQVPQTIAAADALRCRFPALNGKATAVAGRDPYQPDPPLEDYALAVIKAVDKHLVPSAQRRARGAMLRDLLGAGVAGEDARQKRKRALQTLASWLDANREQLPEAVQAILARAGIPDWHRLESPEEKSSRERAEQERLEGTVLDPKQAAVLQEAAAQALPERTHLGPRRRAPGGPLDDE